MLGSALIKTLQLAAASAIWIIVVTPFLGIGAAAKPGGVIDKLTRIYCLCGTAIPTFVLGFILIRLFSVNWKLLPAIPAQPNTHPITPGSSSWLLSLLWQWLRS
jgi:ABC-type dipeptide/oligopeptide/nickel transport system permease component